MEADYEYNIAAMYASDGCRSSDWHEAMIVLPAFRVMITAPETSRIVRVYNQQDTNHGNLEGSLERRQRHAGHPSRLIRQMTGVRSN